MNIKLLLRSIPLFIYSIVLFSIFFYLLLDDFFTYNIYNLFNPNMTPDVDTFFKIDIYNKIISVLCALLYSTFACINMIKTKKYKWYLLIHNITLGCTIIFVLLKL